MMRMMWLALALAGALVLAWQGTVTPRAVGETAPPEVFSTGRALKDIAVIAARPHPTGSAANRQVRDYLLERMTALGLSPVVQPTDVVDAAPDRGSPWISGARVENLIGVLPGRDRKAPALMLMAHYDSVAGSPGAADDATGQAHLQIGHGVVLGRAGELQAHQEVRRLAHAAGMVVAWYCGSQFALCLLSALLS